MSSEPQPTRLLDITQDPSLRRFFWISAAFFAGVGLFNFVFHAMAESPHQIRMMNSFILFLVGIGALLLLRMGHVVPAFKTLLWGCWVMCCAGVFFSSGVRSSYIAAYPLIIIFSGWAISVRYGMVFAGLSGAYLTGLAVYEAAIGRVIVGGIHLAVPAIVNVSVMFLSALAVYFYSKAYRDRLGQLAASEAVKLKQENALRESESRFRILLDRLDSIAVQGYSPDGTVHYWNAGAEKLYGYPASEAVGANLIDLIIPHDMQDAVRVHVRHMADTGCGDEPCELVLKRRDGALVPVYSSHAVLKREGGAAELFCLDIDLTERKQAESELEQHRHHLSQLVGERTAELVLAREEAERSARVKGEFLANMSHEIRTPLNGVIGLSRMGGMGNKSAAEMKALFSKIHNAGNGLLGIINDILDFSKLDAGKLNVEQVSTNPGLVLRETIELLQEDAKAKGVELSLHVAPDFPLACLSDPVRLRQIILNLVSNALKFTPEGSVNVNVAVEDGWLSIRVKDTGIGMTNEQIARVFEAFEQADGSTTRKFGGTGLGLSITHRIVEVMQGTIQVSSKPGEGSCFNVRLPYLPAAAVVELLEGDKVSSGEATSLRLAGIRILVAEDNEINQIVIRENLSDEGAEIVVVGDGLAAVNRVIADGAEAFDIVLMDIQMPVMGGYEATSNLLAMAPDLPIIGQTAHAYGEEKARCFAVGMVDHIAKPLDPNLLVEKILTHARRRK